MAVMTREEIMAMPAGPDLDRLVAEALGNGASALTEHQWTESDACYYCTRCFAARYTDIMPVNGGELCVPVVSPYSTDIYAAWKAWEAMPQNERGINCDSDKILLCGDDGVMVGYLRYPDDYYVKIDTEIIATAPTVPLAICRAFLIWKLEEGK